MRARYLLPRTLVALLVLPALVLTASRLLDVERTPWVQLVAFTPLATVPYAVALVALVAWGIRRRSRGAAGLAVLCAAALTLHAWWIAPWLTDDQPPAPEGARALTVMTANMFFGGADGGALVRAASREEVDVLVVEEVTATLLAELEAAGLGEVLAHRAGHPGRSASGTMVFAAEPVGEPTLVGTTWDSWLVEVGDLSLLAVHPFSPVDVDSWRADHRLLLETAEAEQPDLVVGDFNATLDHAQMRSFADSGWRSVTDLAGQGWQPTWSPGGLLGDADLPFPAMAQIDHVLLGPSLVAVASHTVDVRGTDHHALVAEVAVNP